MKHRIELIWYRDSKGYTLLPEMLSKKGVTSILCREAGRPERIQGNGGELIPYHPLDEGRPIFREFADIKKTPKGLLDFIDKYGLLIGSAGYDAVSEMLQAASDMNHLLKGNNIRNMDIQSIRLDSKLSFDFDGNPTLILSPKSLLNGLWLQLGNFLADGRTSVQECGLCHTLFETGPGTGRRLDAKFCSDQHRIAFNSQRQTQKEPAQIKRRK